MKIDIMWVSIGNEIVPFNVEEHGDKAHNFLLWENGPEGGPILFIEEKSEKKSQYHPSLLLRIQHFSENGTYKEKNLTGAGTVGEHGKKYADEDGVRWFSSFLGIGTPEKYQPVIKELLGVKKAQG